MAGPITQADMEAIFAVTDGMGIDREAVEVPLGRKDPGSVRRLGQQVQITMPASLPAAEWTETLRSELEKLGTGRRRVRYSVFGTRCSVLGSARAAMPLTSSAQRRIPNTEYRNLMPLVVHPLWHHLAGDLEMDVAIHVGIVGARIFHRRPGD